MSATSATIIIIVMILIAGVLQGAFALPMNYAGQWKWENIWLSYSLLAFFFLPAIITLATPSHLLDTLCTAPPVAILRVSLFGFGWGLGAVFFGLGIDYAGMALGMSIMTGLIDAVGTFIPLAILSPHLLAEQKGKLIVGATLITVVGVGICGYAGHLRERDIHSTSTGSMRRKASLAAALTVCILAGLLSAMFNFGYAFSGPIIQASRRAGAPRAAALNVVWILVLASGLIPNATYCIYLLRRDGSWRLYSGAGTAKAWMLALIMAVMWLGGTLLYGVAGARLGKLGPSLGWAAWNAVMILAAVGCGLSVGEWRHSRRAARRTLWFGVAIIIIAVVVLGLAGVGSS